VNRAVLTTPSGDYGRLARLHEAQARVLHAEERPYIHLQELMFAEDLEALAAIDRGFSGRVAIIGGECCPACGRAKRTQVTFGDERRLRRLPHRECAKGWCNCLYVGAPVT
jgi:hypothetical protein